MSIQICMTSGQKFTGIIFKKGRVDFSLFANTAKPVIEAYFWHKPIPIHENDIAASN